MMKEVREWMVFICRIVSLLCTVGRDVLELFILIKQLVSSIFITIKVDVSDLEMFVAFDQL